MRKDEFLKLGLDEETAKKCEVASLAELENFVAKVDVEGMKKQIAELQAENRKKDEAHLAELAKIKIDTAIEAAIPILFPIFLLYLKVKNYRLLKKFLRHFPYFT